MSNLYFAHGLGHNNIEVYKKNLFGAHIKFYMKQYISAKWPETNRNFLSESSTTVLTNEQPKMEEIDMMNKEDYSRVNPDLVCQSALFLKDSICGLPNNKKCHHQYRQLWLHLQHRNLSTRARSYTADNTKNVDFTAAFSIT